MADTLPSLGIVIPILNEAQHIRVALDSLTAQEYPDLEVVIYDAGSTDGTLEILRTYDYQLLVEPRLGQMAAINRGWSSSKAEFVTWMAGDDRLLPGALKRLAAELRAHPEAGFVHAEADIIDGEGRVTGHLSPGDVQFRDLAFEFTLVPQTALIRHAALARSGMMDESRRFLADHDLFLRLAQYYPGRYIPFTAAQYRVHAGSEDARHLPAVGAAQLEVIEQFFRRPDLTLAQRALQPRARAGAYLFAGATHCLAGDRRSGWRSLAAALRHDPLAAFSTRRGLGLLARLLSPVAIRPYGLRNLANRLRAEPSRR